MGQRLILSEEEKRNIQEMYGLISEQSSNVNDLLKDLENFEVEDEQLTGCVEGDCENGKGKYVYKDGSVYEGEFKNGKKDGRGVYTYGSESTSEGSVYKGYFTQGKRNGFGKFTHIEGWSYEGVYYGINRRGIGYLTCEDGTRHEQAYNDEGGLICGTWCDKNSLVAQITARDNIPPCSDEFKKNNDLYWLGIKN